MDAETGRPARGSRAAETGSRIQRLPILCAFSLPARAKRSDPPSAEPEPIGCIL